MISADNCSRYCSTAMPMTTKTGWIGDASAAAVAKMECSIQPAAQHGQYAQTCHWHRPDAHFYFGQSTVQQHLSEEELLICSIASQCDAMRGQNCLANSGNSSTYPNVTDCSGDAWYAQQQHSTTPRSVVPQIAAADNDDESVALSQLENWTTQRRRCAHSLIERRYRSSINERMAELKSLVAGTDAKLSKSAILRTAIEQLKRLRQSNDSLRAENEHLQRLLSSERHRHLPQSELCNDSSAAYVAVQQPTATTAFDAADWLRRDGNNAGAESDADASAPFSYSAKVTLYALMACFVISNPAQLIGSGAWSRQLEWSFSFSRLFSAIIGNNVHRILLLLVVNLLVVIFVTTKLCYGWRNSSSLENDDEHLWSSCMETKKSADDYTSKGHAEAALECLISCATVLRTIDGRSYPLYELLKALLLPAGRCTIDPNKIACAAAVYDDIHKLTLAGVQWKEPAYTGRQLSLLSLKYLRKGGHRLDKSLRGEIFLLAAIESRSVPLVGKLLVAFFVRKARGVFAEDNNGNVDEMCWLYSPLAEGYIVQLKPRSFAAHFSQSVSGCTPNGQFINWLGANFEQTALLESCQLLLFGRENPTSRQYLRFCISKCMTSKRDDWKVRLIKLAVGDEEATLKDERKSASPKEVLSANTLEELCFVALRAKRFASTDDRTVDAHCAIFNVCERCADSIRLKTADDDVEELLQCLAIQWCLEACVLLIGAGRQSALPREATARDRLLKKALSKLVQVERAQAEQHPLLEEKLLCHEKLKLLLEMGNPIKVKYAIVGCRPKGANGSAANDPTCLTQPNTEEWLSLVIQNAVRPTRLDA
uniref:BHLH domain-containing protein n=1 Tax=Trichuris muris TaxID=70415 RepID=A0A5S6Q3N5_TRIMR